MESTHATTGDRSTPGSGSGHAPGQPAPPPPEVLEGLPDGVVDEPADAAAARYRQPPAGLVVRRPVDEDRPRIAALYERAARSAASSEVDRGALRTERDLRRTWAARRNDALVVEADGEVVGYLEFHEAMDPWTPELDTYAEGRVDPAAAGAGVGGFLLARAVDRARRAAERVPGVPTVLRTTLVDPAPATLAWFADRGLEPARHLLALRLDLGDALPTPVWPAGTRAVRADEVPVEALHTALVASFADHHLGATDDLDTWRRVVLDRGRADLSASVAAVDEDGRVVGVALGLVGANDDPGLAVVTDLGVLPDQRGRGLATAVLRAAFARFAERGAARVGLEVDDVTMDGALRLYQRAGMEVVHHTVVLATDVA